MIAGGLWGCQEKWRQSEAHGRAGGPPPVSLSLQLAWAPPQGGRRQPAAVGPFRPCSLFGSERLRRLGREGRAVDEPAPRQPCSILPALVGEKETLPATGNVWLCLQLS